MWVRFDAYYQLHILCGCDLMHTINVLHILCGCARLCNSSHMILVSTTEQGREKIRTRIAMCTLTLASPSPGHPNAADILGKMQTISNGAPIAFHSVAPYRCPVMLRNKQQSLIYFLCLVLPEDAMSINKYERAPCAIKPQRYVV